MWGFRSVMHVALGFVYTFSFFFFFFFFFPQKSWLWIWKAGVPIISDVGSQANGPASGRAPTKAGWGCGGGCASFAGRRIFANREETGRRTGSTDPVSGRSAREEEEEEEGGREGEREEDVAPTWLPSVSSKSSKICRRIRQHHAVPVRIWSTIVEREFGNCC